MERGGPNVRLIICGFGGAAKVSHTVFIKINLSVSVSVSLSLSLSHTHTNTHTHLPKEIWTNSFLWFPAKCLTTDLN